MTITNDQILLMKSEVMTDNDDGGGRMSGNPVIDNEVNNTFNDISRLSRVYGNVDLRKLYMFVNSPNTDTLLDAHSILDKQPDDPRVKVTLFKTGSHTDRRIDAQDRIESYVVKATEANFWLWGRQLTGQRSIQCLQGDGWPAPEPGEVYTLVAADESYEQYVRVTEVNVSKQRFTEVFGGAITEFELNTLEIRLANTLGFDFEGSNPSRLGRQSGSDGVLSTQVANAAKYYGASQTTVEALTDDQSVKIDDVYSNLVPSAQAESALVDRFGSLTSSIVLPSRSSPITWAITRGSGASAGGFRDYTYYLPTPVVPGTMEINSSGGIYEEIGDGLMGHVVGSEFLTEAIIDYENGIVYTKTVSFQFSQNTALNFTYIPGAVVSKQSQSFSKPITQQTRSLNYVVTLRPIPAPGTMIVEYRVLGRWNRMYDDGTGAIRGDGVGQINFATGSVNVTLPALPDEGSEIIFAWGEHHSYNIHDGVAIPAEPIATFFLTQPAPDGNQREVTPGSVTIGWSVGASDYSVTDDSNGNLTGDGTGTIEYYGGKVNLKPNPAPQPVDGDYSLTFTEWSADAKQAETTPAAQQSINYTVSNGPVRPGSVSLTAGINRISEITVDGGAGVYSLNEVAYDDGNGVMKRLGNNVGTINYATGAITFDLRMAYSYQQQVEAA